MRKILILTDFSDHILPYAVNLFKEAICEFFIMHAYQDAIYTETLSNASHFDNLFPSAGRLSKQKLEGIVEAMTAEFPNSRHKYHVISTDKTLLEEADSFVDAHNIDLIVMGSKDDHNSKPITFGSHTPQVIKFVKCPVLVIPEHAVYASPKHFLFPTHYLIPYKTRELELLCDLAYMHGAVIDVLYNSKCETLSLHQKDNQRLLKEELGKNQINFKLSSTKAIVDAVNEYIKNNTIDLLVLVNSKHLSFDDIVFHTILDEITMTLDIPYLILQNRGI